MTERPFALRIAKSGNYEILHNGEVIPKGFNNPMFPKSPSVKSRLDEIATSYAQTAPNNGYVQLNLSESELLYSL